MNKKGQITLFIVIGIIILIDFFNALSNLFPPNLEKIGNKAAEKPKRAITEPINAKAAE